MTHTIKKLSFGDDYPGMVNPLDGSTQLSEETGRFLAWDERGDVGHIIGFSLTPLAMPLDRWLFHVPVLCQDRAHAVH